MVRVGAGRGKGEALLSSPFPLNLPRMTEPHEEPADPLPALERAVAERPEDAKALVALANHYWLIGAGPEVVGDLASRAIASDADNRAAWHLWALAESNPRERVARWQQVSKRFPTDDLAKANLRSEEHTSELQSQFHLVCRLLLEKKKK